MSKGPPTLSLVSEKTDAEVLRAEADRRRQEAMERLAWALRRCAANFMRVCRGAGEPGRLAQDCQDVISSVDAYRQEVGSWPRTDQVSRALQIERAAPRQTQEYTIDSAVEGIVRGSLQLAASEMVQQLTQERRGRSDIMDGVRLIHQVWNETRAELAAEEKRARAISKGTKRKPVRKARKAQARKPPTIQL